MKKKVPVVTVAEPEEATHLAGLPLEATVELADLAAAVKEGLLGFCADVATRQPDPTTGSGQPMGRPSSSLV